VQSELETATASRSREQTAAESPPGSRIVCRQAISAEETIEHFAIRHEIFVAEQHIFRGSDRDEHDERDSVVRLLGYCDGVAAGSVRLYELDRPAGIWQGDRLAVLPAFRLRGVGAPLVGCAVAAAAVRGGRLMKAHVQPANVSFFQRLGWTSAGSVELYAGLIHQPMQTALPTPDEGLATLARFASGVTVRGR
jgi:putative N-acetyltransferase (TIGR04045 family)